MSICFLENTTCYVFNKSTLAETTMTLHEFQSKFNPSHLVHVFGTDKCIIKSNLEEYTTEKNNFTLVNQYNKFIRKKAKSMLELNTKELNTKELDARKPSNIFAYYIKQCEQMYPMSTYTMS
jgi:hypothetical protein